MPADTEEASGSEDSSGNQGHADSEEAAGSEAYPENSGLLELKDARSVLVFTPGDYDPSISYPSVYLMPSDGLHRDDCLMDRAPEKIMDLMKTDKVMDMILVLPEFTLDSTEDMDKPGNKENGAGMSSEAGGYGNDALKDLYDQLELCIEAVEENYSVISDPSMRGVIGNRSGGYLAFLFGYMDPEGNLSGEPLYFKAIASHDGDFTENPYSGAYPGIYPDIYNSLYGSVNTHYSSECQWLKNYYTYIDSNSDDDLASAKGGSNDLAILYRTDALDLHHSASAWDYSVFEYSSRSADHYGSWTDNLKRSLNRFSIAFGMETEAEAETEYIPSKTVSKGDDRQIDLMGKWHFKAYKGFSMMPGKDDLDGIDYLLNEEDWESWEEVTPALDWWTPDFASSLNSNPWFSGYAWYIRSFELPEGFDRRGLAFYEGMVDEADEAYLNGVRIGSTGIEKEGGSYDMSNPWDTDRVYPFDEGLLKEGENVIAVRVCNSSGGGGWYRGPVRIAVYKDGRKEEDSRALYYETSMISEALGGKEVIYRVLLPSDYYESKRRYPVTYMLHGIGSTGKSFEIDGAVDLIREGMDEGTIPPCIVIFPDDSHPSKQSWWSGPYASMLNDDLVSEVDKTLRTVPDRRFRGLAGESMGGGGAYLNAFKRPELYSWVFDIYGAINFTGISNTMMAEKSTKEFLSQQRQYFIAGNQDFYTFDLVHIPYDRRLDELGVEHVFEIDNGGHDAAFFLPYLKEAFAYILKDTKEGGRYAGLAESIADSVSISDISAKLKDDGRLNIAFKAEISDYKDLLPAYYKESTDTEAEYGDLCVPLDLTVSYEGRTLLEKTIFWTISAETAAADGADGTDPEDAAAGTDGTDPADVSVVSDGNDSADRADSYEEILETEPELTAEEAGLIDDISKLEIELLPASF